MPRYDLYKYTEAQAEAMSPRVAAELLGKQKEMNEEGGDYGEAWYRELSYYAGPDAYRRGDVKEGDMLWDFWSKILSEEEMQKLTVKDAFSLRPEVKSILKGKVKGGRRRKSRRSRKTRSTRALTARRRV